MFYDIFLKLCEQANTTPAKVRKDLGISQSTMASWKSRGLTPNAVTLHNLAEYFGVTVEILLGLTPDEQTDMKLLEEHILKQTGRSRSSVHEYLVSEKITEVLDRQRIKATEDADRAVVDSYEAISEEVLMNELLDTYRYLNRRGRIEAVERIIELGGNRRYMLYPPNYSPNCEQPVPQPDQPSEED